MGSNEEDNLESKDNEEPLKIEDTRINSVEAYATGINDRKCSAFNQTGHLAHNCLDNDRRSQYDPEKQAEPRQAESETGQFVRGKM